MSVSSNISGLDLRPSDFLPYRVLTHLYQIGWVVYHTANGLAPNTQLRVYAEEMDRLKEKPYFFFKILF